VAAWSCDADRDASSLDLDEPLWEFDADRADDADAVCALAMALFGKDGGESAALVEDGDGPRVLVAAAGGRRVLVDFQDMTAAFDGGAPRPFRLSLGGSAP